MKSRNKVKTAKKEPVIEIKPFKDLIKEESQNNNYCEFIKPGEVNLIFGSKNIHNTLFAYWLGIRLAPKVDSVHLFSIKANNPATYFSQTEIPCNFYKIHVSEKFEYETEKIIEAIKSTIKTLKGKHILILESIQGFKKPLLNEEEAIKIISHLGELEQDLKSKDSELTTIIFSDCGLLELWKPVELNRLPFSAKFKDRLNNIFYLGISKESCLHYIKSLKPGKKSGKVLLFESVNDLRNYHFKMKSWGNEKDHLSVDPTIANQAVLTIIGGIAISVIRHKHWKGIHKESTLPESAIKAAKEECIVEILENFYENRTVIPFDHIQYFLSDTNITINDFDKVAQKYFLDKGRKYDLIVEGRNIQPIEKTNKA